MNVTDEDLDLETVASRWWAVLARGIAAILFGIVAFSIPGISLLALILIWGCYAAIDGVFALVVAARGAPGKTSWGWLLVEGIVGVGAGLVTFIWPAMTALVLLMVIGVWAVVTGVLEVMAAVALRKQLRGEWMLALGGTLSIAFGMLVLLSPGAGALALLGWIAGYSIVSGALLVGVGLRLRSRQSGERGERGATGPRLIASHGEFAPR